MPLLEACNLSKSFPTPEGPIPVLQNLSFTLETKDIVAVTGVSGVGKSTLLHILGGLDQPDEGRVLFQGEDLHRFSPERQAAFRNRELGFMFQYHFLLPEFTALENVMMPLLIRGLPLTEAQPRAEQALEEVRLAERMTHIPSRLSGGEAQRVALARAVVTAPSLLLADEPTGNLDEDTGNKVFDLLCRLVDNHPLSILVVTHNTSLAGRCQRVLRLSQGALALRSIGTELHTN